MVTVGCIISISACGQNKITEETGSSDTVKEITVGESKKPAASAEAEEKKPGLRRPCRPNLTTGSLPRPGWRAMEAQ